MKVKELIEELSKFDDNDEVILQKDAEGNGYSPLCDLGLGAYVALNAYSGESYLLPEQLDDEARQDGYTEEDVSDEWVRAVFLVPTN